MKNQKLIILLLIVLFPLFATAQDCANYLSTQTLARGYEYNGMSKSGTVKTGKKYKFVFNLTKGKNYLFTFHASSGLNNNMDFKIIDQSNGQVIMYLPGEVAEPEYDTGGYGEYDEYGNPVEKEAKQEEVKPEYKPAPNSNFSNVLKAEFVKGALSYPYFQLKPVNSMNLEVIIDVHDLDDGAVRKGCLGILIQDVKTDDEFASF